MRLAAEPAHEAAGEQVLLDRELREAVASFEHLDEAALDQLGRLDPVDRLVPPQ